MGVVGFWIVWGGRLNVFWYADEEMCGEVDMVMRQNAIRPWGPRGSRWSPGLMFLCQRRGEVAYVWKSYTVVCDKWRLKT